MKKKKKNQVVLELRVSYLLNHTLCTPVSAVPSPESQISPFWCGALGDSGRRKFLFKETEKETRAL